MVRTISWEADREQSQDHVLSVYRNMPAPRSHCIVADVDLSMRRSPQVQRHKTRWRKRSYLGCHRKCLHHIPRRTLRHFFLLSAPRQLHRHFHPEVCKTRQIYIDVGIFISRCFLCSDIILCLGIFTRKLGGKTRNLGGKKRNQAEFCSKHFSALNNMTRPCKKSFFWGLCIYSGNRQK